MSGETITERIARMTPDDLLDQALAEKAAEDMLAILAAAGLGVVGLLSASCAVLMRVGEEIGLPPEGVIEGLRDCYKNVEKFEAEQAVAQAAATRGGES